MSSTPVSVSSQLIRTALLPLVLLVPAFERSAQAQLVWTTVDPRAPQPSAWGGTVITTPPVAAAGPVSVPLQPIKLPVQPIKVSLQPASPSPQPLLPAASQSAARQRSAPLPSRMPATVPAASPVPIVIAVPGSVPSTAQLSQAPAPAASSPDAIRQLRERLRIQPIVKRERPWPSPSLSPGVPSAFVAGWGDVFISASAATPGNQRDGVVDGSWSAGFGVGDAAKAVALEVSGGCGSIKDFCANGSFTARLGRLLINESQSRVSLAAAWQNFAQWGNEGRQDNVYYGALSYAVPLQPGRPFAQTLQFNVGVGNSQYAPFVSTNSESQIGAFASLGVEVTRYLGLSAGWSGRGANAQLSLTPFRDAPITINLLGADLFNQTPAGTVGVLSISWGTNFLTPSF